MAMAKLAMATTGFRIATFMSAVSASVSGGYCKGVVVVSEECDTGICTGIRVVVQEYYTGMSWV